MTEIADTLDTLDTSQDVVPDPTASEVHPRLAQRSLTPGALNGTIQVGPPGQNGTDGADGIGVPPGGTEGQVLAKADDDDYDTEWVDAPTGGGGGSVVVAGPPITGAATVAPNTFYPINLAANLGNVAITMPSAPDQGTVIEFTRQDTNIFTSTPRVTAGAGDNIGDTSPYVISMRNSLVTFTYWGTTWWPAMPVSGASGLNGATPSSAFAPTIMSRDGGGRAQVEDPVAAKDIVNLEYLQAHGSGGTSNVVTGSQADVTGTSITSTVAGSGTSSAGGVEAIAIGDRASADGGNSIAIGLNALADTDDNIAIGNSASADTGIHTVAIGNHAAASADGAVAIGDFASAGNQVVVIGTGASSDNSGIAIGNGASSGTGATTSEAIAIGNVAYATGEDAICLGVGNAEGDQAISIGTASALAKDSLAIGGNARVGSSAPGGVAIGTDNTGSGAQVLQPNEFMLGTNLHHVEIPGLLNLVPETTTPPTLRDGDVWIDASGAWARVNGVTKQLDLSGGGAAGFPPITDQTALANVNGLTAPGLYLVKPAQLVLPPASSAALGNIVGILCVYSNQVGTSTATISQTWYGRSGSQNNGGEIWTRNGFGTTPSWTEWSPAAATLTVTDYNAAIVPGDYSLMSATLTNGPGGAIRSGYLHVSTRSAAGTGTNTYLAQQWIVVDQTVPEVWVRTYAVSTWSAWKRTDSVMPAGGALGAPLIKNSATDLDVKWGLASQLVGFNNASKPASDLGNTYPAGVSQWTLSDTQASAGGWPCGSNFCQIFTSRAADGGNGTAQWCLSTTNGVQFAYYRSGNQNGWSPWVALAPAGAVNDQVFGVISGLPSWGSGFAPIDQKFGNTNRTAPSGDDLLTAAVYPVGASYMALSTTQGGVGNWPVATTASILTFKIVDPAPDASTGWTRGWQIWVRNANSAQDMRFRTSSGAGGTWGPWITVANDTGWKTLPLASGYQSYGSSPAPAYRVKGDTVYFRGQVAPTSGTWGVGAFAFVTALPAEAQPTLGAGGYVMVVCASGSNAIFHRVYIAAGNTATMTCGVGTAGAAYVDLGNLAYPLN